MAVPLVPGWRCCAYHAPRQRAEVQPTHLSSRCAPISTAGAGSCATTAPWSGWCVAGTACEPAEARTALPAWECRQGRMQRCQRRRSRSAPHQPPQQPLQVQLVLHQLHSQVPGVADHLLHHLPSVARAAEWCVRLHVLSSATTLWRPRPTQRPRRCTWVVPTHF